MSEPLVLSFRNVEAPYTGFDSVAEDAIEGILACKDAIEEWAKQLDSSPPKLAHRRIEKSTPTRASSMDVRLDDAIRRLRDSAEGAVVAVVCIVKNHEQLFRAMSGRLRLASQVGKIFPHPEIKQLGQEISQQIDTLAGHIALMKTHMDELEKLIQPPSLDENMPTKQSTRTPTRTVMDVLGAALPYAAQAPVRIPHMVANVSLRFVRMSLNICDRQSLRGSAGHPDVRQLLHELKRTVPLQAGTVARMLSTYQINKTVQELERNLFQHKYAIISPDVAEAAEATWAEEAEELSRLHCSDIVRTV